MCGCFPISNLPWCLRRPVTTDRAFLRDHRPTTLCTPSTDATSTRSELETEQTKLPAKEPSVIMGKFLLRR